MSRLRTSQSLHKKQKLIPTAFRFKQVWEVDLGSKNEKYGLEKGIRGKELVDIDCRAVSKGTYCRSGFHSESIGNMIPAMSGTFSSLAS